MLTSVAKFIDINNKNFIGLLLYGSQNYRLSTLDSDIDVIMIVHSYPSNSAELFTKQGKMIVYTLNHFIELLKNGDDVCYQALFSDYKLLNPAYEECFLSFIERFSACMNYNRIKWSLKNVLQEHLDKLKLPRPIDSNCKYNKRRLYRAMQVHNQLTRINIGESYKSSIVYDNLTDYNIIKIKTIDNYLSIKEFNVLLNSLLKYFNSLPTYDIIVNNKEEICFNSFYIDMQRLYDNMK
mgnify:CR=1 FL=1